MVNLYALHLPPEQECSTLLAPVYCADAEVLHRIASALSAAEDSSALVTNASCPYEFVIDQIARDPVGITAQLEQALALVQKISQRHKEVYATGKPL